VSPDRSPEGNAPGRRVPDGYRQGVITAITVMLGFSLYFLRFWHFEAGGSWTSAAVIAAGLMVASVLVELVALWRSLQLDDESEPVYRRTLLWFLAGIVTTGLGVVVAAFA
jgi:hypothetical protein